MDTIFPISVKKANGLNVMMKKLRKTIKINISTLMCICSFIVVLTLSQALCPLNFDLNPFI